MLSILYESSAAYILYIHVFQDFNIYLGCFNHKYFNETKFMSSLEGKELNSDTYWIEQ